VSGEERAQSVGIVLTAIISLQGHERKPELGVNVGVKRTDNRKNFRLRTYWNNPNVMSEIIQEDDIVFESRMTKHRGSPDIRVNKLKGKIRLSFRSTKR
jgi:hypothetical protein